MESASEFTPSAGYSNYDFQEAQSSDETQLETQTPKIQDRTPVMKLEAPKNSGSLTITNLEGNQLATAEKTDQQGKEAIKEGVSSDQMTTSDVEHGYTDLSDSEEGYPVAIRPDYSDEAEMEMEIVDHDEELEVMDQQDIDHLAEAGAARHEKAVLEALSPKLDSITEKASDFAQALASGDADKIHQAHNQLAVATADANADIATVQDPALQKKMEDSVKAALLEGQELGRIASEAQKDDVGMEVEIVASENEQVGESEGFSFPEGVVMQDVRSFSSDAEKIQGLKADAKAAHALKVESQAAKKEELNSLNTEFQHINSVMEACKDGSRKPKFSNGKLTAAHTGRWGQAKGKKTSTRAGMQHVLDKCLEANEKGLKYVTLDNGKKVEVAILYSGMTKLDQYKALGDEDPLKKSVKGAFGEIANIQEFKLEDPEFVFDVEVEDRSYSQAACDIASGDSLLAQAMIDGGSVLMFDVPVGGGQETRKTSASLEVVVQIADRADRIEMEELEPEAEVLVLSNMVNFGVQLFDQELSVPSHPHQKQLFKEKMLALSNKAESRAQALGDDHLLKQAESLKEKAENMTIAGESQVEEVQGDVEYGDYDVRAMTSEQLYEDFSSAFNESFLSIDLAELDRPSRYKEAPTLMADTKNFNGASRMAMLGILEAESTEEATSMIEKVIDTANLAFENHNYALGSALLSSLSGSQVSRLDDAWKGVSQDHMSRKEQMDELMNSKNNSKNYRAAVANAFEQGEAVVPFVGMTRADFTLGLEGKTTVKEGVMQLDLAKKYGGLKRDLLLQQRRLAEAENKPGNPDVRGGINTVTKMSQDQFDQRVFELSEKHKPHPK